MAHVRGWKSIRDTDRGHRWENLVLDELLVAHPARSIHFWRDKSQREIDFVIEREEGEVDAVEAKINPDALDAKSLKAFRNLYPKGKNYVVCPHVESAYSIRRDGLSVRVCAPPDFR